MRRFAFRSACSFLPPGILLGAAGFCALTFGLIPNRAQADTVELENGGSLRATWLNPGPRPPKVYELELPGGGRLSLPAGQVKSISRERPLELEYEAKAAATPDTVEDQWKLAEWCRLNVLTAQRAAHLRHIVELDPDNALARAALGFNRVNGKWITPAEWQQENGYTLYQGRWRSAQDIELLEERRREELAQREWTVRLRKYRDGLNTNKAPEILEKIAAIRAPEAVPGLTELLYRERTRDGKRLYLETLCQIGTPAAVAVIVKLSIDDPDEEVFHLCLDQLLKLKLPQVTNAYIQVLKDVNNVRVNRAAFALGKFGDKSAVEPLIEALVTTHKIVIAPPGGGNAINTSFSSDGQTGVQAGAKPQVISKTVSNQEVLNALSQLAGGVNFEFDKPAWRRWAASQKKPAGPENPGLRRD